MIELHVGEDGQVKLTLCGASIEHLVKGASFQLEQDYGVPRLRVELNLAILKDVYLGGEAIVGLSTDMVELLQSFGWTPPPEPGS